MRIVGLSGKAGSGKDYIGRLLVKHFGYRSFSFALPIKIEGMAAGFTPEEVFITKPPHVRTWLQEYGVAKREEEHDFWIKRAFILISMMGWQKVVITDVRFPNEAAAILSVRNSTLIRIEHGNRPYPLAGTEAANHVSETAMDDFPAFMHTITNCLEKTDEALVSQLRKILKEPGNA